MGWQPRHGGPDGGCYRPPRELPEVETAMSAAEPVDPALTASYNHAAVISLSAHRNVFPLHGGRNATDTPVVTEFRDEEQASLDHVASDVETSMNASGYTLSNDDTAAVYGLTLDVVEHVLRGAAEMGIIDDAQHDELAVLVAGLQEAPRRI